MTGADVRGGAPGVVAPEDPTALGEAPPEAPRDLVAHWSSAAFRDEADSWARTVLAARGIALRGPLEPHRVRFWSAVLSAPTDAGRVWFKAANPGQAFEAPLLACLARLAPEDVVVPLATDAARGWLLLPDDGPTVRDRGGVTDDDWEALVVQAARLQVTVAGRGAALAATGLPALGPDDAAPYVARLVEHLAGLAPGDPQHVDRDEARALLRGLERVAPGFDDLAASGIPSTLQPNDLSVANAVAPRWGGRFRLFDLGDASWSHPFAALQVPLRMATRRWPAPPERDDPLARRLRDAYLGVWGLPPGVDADHLVDAADRLASVHRCESWRRLLAHADRERLGVPTPRLADWLADAVRPRTDDAA